MEIQNAWATFNMLNKKQLDKMTTDQLYVIRWAFIMGYVNGQETLASKAQKLLETSKTEALDYRHAKLNALPS